MSSYRSIRDECYEANLALPRLGLVDLTFGNVSVCDPAQAVFGIKPSGVEYALRHSSDTPTHRCLFRAFPDVRAIVHTHSRHAVSFAQAGRPIPCLGTTHADYFNGEVPVTRAMTPTEIQGAYEWETGNVIVERFRDLRPLEVPAVLVHGHGPFAWGSNGSKAVETAHALEIVAEMALKTLLLNPAAPSLSCALLAKHFLRKHGTAAYYGQSKPAGQA
jgi:L-ribulose-5-phosphate 4-epimerase